MSKYKGQHGGKKGNKFGQGPPTPLFGQCPKEIVFSLMVITMFMMMMMMWVMMLKAMGENGFCAKVVPCWGRD